MRQIKASSVLFLLAAPSLAQAVPVTFVSVEREIRAFDGSSQTAITSSEPGLFDWAVSAGRYGTYYATQNSTIGLTSIGQLYAHYSAWSFIRMEFTVNEPVEYRLDVLEYVYDSYDGSESTTVEFRMINGPIIFPSRTDPPVYSGILQAGSYSFYAEALAFMGSQGGRGYAQTDFTLVLSPEPSLAFMVLLSLGFATSRSHTLRLKPAPSVRPKHCDRHSGPSAEAAY